jgi:D-alanine-D-alanine ligase-like ATP-grasp enzyme
MSNPYTYLENMKDIIRMTALSVKKKINKLDRLYCFEIFGYDFMLDENAKLWLIEINTNPCLEESSPLLEQLLPRMLGNGQLIQTMRLS